MHKVMAPRNQTLKLGRKDGVIHATCKHLEVFLVADGGRDDGASGGT